VLQAILQREPGFVPALLNLADLHRQFRRDAQAEPLLRKATELAPASAEVA
jgi:hypothetical protein